MRLRKQAPRAPTLHQTSEQTDVVVPEQEQQQHDEVCISSPQHHTGNSPSTSSSKVANGPPAWFRGAENSLASVTLTVSMGLTFDLETSVALQVAPLSRQWWWLEREVKIAATSRAAQ